MSHSASELTNGKRSIETLQEVKRLLATFSHASAIGLGICDKQLRYQSINTALAAINGISVEAHLGNTVREVLGQTAGAVEPALAQVLATGEAVTKEITGELPSREGVVHCIVSYFPVKRTANRGQCLGGISVEITELKRLHQLCSKLTNGSVRTKDKERYWRARELQDSLHQYFKALTVSLASVTQHLWQLDKSADEQLAPAIELLDQRVLAIKTLVSAVAEEFPSD